VVIFCEAFEPSTFYFVFRWASKDTGLSMAIMQSSPGDMVLQPFALMALGISHIAPSSFHSNRFGGGDLYVFDIVGCQMGSKSIGTNAEGKDVCTDVFTEVGSMR